MLFQESTYVFNFPYGDIDLDFSEFGIGRYSFTNSDSHSKVSLFLAVVIIYKSHGFS